MIDIYDPKVLPTARVGWVVFVSVILHGLMLAPTGTFSNSTPLGSFILGCAAGYSWFVHEQQPSDRTFGYFVRILCLLVVTLLFAQNTAFWIAQECT